MGSLDEVARTILERRYLQQDETGEVVETPDEMFHRVAQNLAKAESHFEDGPDPEDVEPEFYDAISSLAFLPNSPTLMNAGTVLQQLAACFVLPVEDDLGSIFESLKHTALIHQSGGGTGFSFSQLRPQGDVVQKTGGVASGPVSFMKIFDAATEQIKQGGRRRGANMGVLDSAHPDVEEFVTAKQEEGVLRNFNLSVATDERFWEAYENGEDYALVNPRNDEEVARVDAQQLLRLMAEMAWGTGDPGILFLDVINEENPLPSKGDIKSTNPCITGDSLVSTGNGLVPAEELYERGTANEVVVDGRLSDEPIKEASSVYKTGEKDVYRLLTREGYELRATADHQIRTIRGWEAVQDLEPGDKVDIRNRKGGFGEHGSAAEGRVLGWLVGDGQLEHGDERASLNFYEDDREITADFVEDVNQVVRDPVTNREYEIGVTESEYPSSGSQAVGRREKIRSTRLYELAADVGLVEDKLQVPDAVLRGSEEMARGFLQALFTADGSVQGNVEKGLSVRLWSTEKSLLTEVQQLLLNFGIASKLYEDREPAGTTELPDGHGGTKTYETKAGHELAIAKDNLVRFEEEIGFLLDRKDEQLVEYLDSYEHGPYAERFRATVESIEHDGHEAVYDLTEPDTSSFVANGIVVHNCGEVPLHPYEACVLGSINLSEMTENGEIDWDRLEETARLATRFLDNAIEMSTFPTDEITEAVHRTRKIGVGVMGFHDMLVDLEIPYDSDEAVACADEVMAFIHDTTWDESQNLAEERGTFPEWEESVIDQPMRNATTTTIAPTGTISMIAGASSGIEPIYNVAYVKQVMGGLEIVNDRFVEIAKDRGFYSEELMEEVHGQPSIQDVEEIPDDVKELFQTAHDVPPERHVEMQAAFQDHVDNAVSKTVNLPEEAEVEDVVDIFETARELGVKGITVFRHGAGGEEVLETEPLKEECASECDWIGNRPEEEPREG